MFSRRRFLRASTIGAGTTLAARVPSLGAQEASSTLPHSIARLTSMRDEAKRITAEERAARQEKARQLMKVNHLDALLLMEGTSLDYFVGVQWGRGR